MSFDGSVCEEEKFIEAGMKLIPSDILEYLQKLYVICMQNKVNIILTR